MRTEIAIISALTLVLSMPLAFGQVETNPDESFFEQINLTNSTTTEPFDQEFQYTLSSDPIQFNTGSNMIFINSDCSVQIKDYSNNIIFENDDYIVRVSDYESDNWTDMEINNATCNVFSYDNAESLEYGKGMKTVQENFEGVLTKYYDISNPEKTKVSIEFENKFYPNHKFMTYEQITLADQNITFNGDQIDLANFVGQSFDRSVLDNYTDVLIGFNNNTAWYQSEIGFDNLWSVDLIDSNKINLNYGKTDTLTPIGEKYVLDPLIWGTSSSTQNSILSFDSTYYSNPTYGADISTATKFDISYGSHSSWIHSDVYLPASDFNSAIAGNDFTWVVRSNAYSTYFQSGIYLHFTDGSQIYCRAWSGHSSPSSARTGCYDGTTLNYNTGTTYLNSDMTISKSGSTYTMNYAGYTVSASKTLDQIQFREGRWTYAFDNNVNLVTTSFNDPNYVAPTVPTAPQTLTTSQSVANEIILNWLAPSSDGNSAITNYKIYLDGTLIDTIGNVLTYTDTISGGEIGSSLTYKVVAVNGIGDSPDSNTSSITSWNVPDQVTGLSAVSGSPITMTWNTPSSDDTITNYKIYRDGTLLDTIGVTNSYTDSTGVPATSYDYSVSAVSAVGEGQQSVTSTAVYGIPPDSPSLVLTHDSSNLNINVAITNGASMGTGTFTQWNIERSADGATGWTVVGTPTASPFTDTVPSSGTWYYRATTQSDHGTSAYSSIVNIAHIDPDLPSITASYYDPNSSDIQVVITDGASFGTGTFTSYSIERSADGSTGWTVVGTPTASPFIDTTTPSVGDWYYRATTITAHGTSSYSSNALASPIAPDPPTNLTSVISNPDPSPLTISLDWDSPINFGSGTLTGYEVYRDGSLITTTGTASQYDDTVSVQGTYVYTIKTVTNHAVSSLSGSTTISTPTQPSADSSVTLSIDNPNPNPLDITVSLIAPSSNGGSAITGYNIFSSPDDITYTLVSSNVNTAQTITVVNSGTWYFKSQAINNVGTAGLGNAVSISTPTVPNSPQNASSVISNINSAPYDVTVSWDLPTSTGGSALTGYNVYRQTGTGAFSLITTTTALGYVDTVPTALNQDYTYKIHAVNNVGESTGFVTTTITTFDVPDAPTLSFTTGTTALSWTVPNSDASITGYEIFRDGSSLTTVTTTSHSDFTPINFGQSYQYEVQAISVLGNSADSNSIVTTPETEITGMVVQGITGTGAVIDWEEPAYYQGQITSYSVYYATPATSANPTISAGTTTNTYSNFAPTLDYDTSYTFGVTVNSPLGNSGFSNLVNATTNVDSSIVAYDPNTGGMQWFDIDSVSEQTVNVIEFQRETQNLNVNGTFTDVDTLQVGYPSWWDDMTCNVDYKFAQKTEQYVEGTDMTAVINSADANQQVIGFQFHDIDNEVIEVECAPQVSQHDDEVSAKYIMTQTDLSTGTPNIPLVTQIQAFQTGDYGTDGEFGALDIVGLFVILISMVGFNRLNPIVGVLLSASLVFGLSFFGIISLPTVLVGVVALVIFLAWGITRNR